MGNETRSSAMEEIALQEADKDVFSAKHSLDKKKTLIIPIEVPGFDEMPAQIEVGGKQFDKKGEIHVTIVGFKKAKELKALFEVDPSLEDKFNEKIQAIDWSTMNVKGGKFKVVQDKEVVRTLGKKEKKKLKAAGQEVPDTVTERDYRESIIQLMDAPVINDLYMKAKEIGIDLGDDPFPHVTLYTHGNKMGIGISSEAEFNALNPEAVEL